MFTARIFEHIELFTRVQINDVVTVLVVLLDTGLTYRDENL